MHNAMTIKTDDLTLTYSPATDSRVDLVESGAIYCVGARAARELAEELRAFGVLDARAEGYVVFVLG